MTYEELKYKIMERMGDDYTCEVYITNDDVVEVCEVVPDEIDVSLFIECRIDDSKVGLIDVSYDLDRQFLDTCIDIIIDFAQTPLEERVNDDEEEI